MYSKKGPTRLLYTKFHNSICIQSWAKSASGRCRYYQLISVSSFADTSITPKSQYRRYIRPILSVDIGMNYRQYLDNFNIAISAINQTASIDYRYRRISAILFREYRWNSSIPIIDTSGLIYRRYCDICVIGYRRYFIYKYRRYFICIYRRYFDIALSKYRR